VLYNIVVLLVKVSNLCWVYLGTVPCDEVAYFLDLVVLFLKAHAILLENQYLLKLFLSILTGIGLDECV